MKRAAAVLLLAAAPLAAAAITSALDAPMARAQSAEAEAAPEVAEPGDARLVAIEGLAAQLGSADAEARRRAFEGLTTLEATDLPAIRARIQHLRRDRPPSNWTDDLIHRFRRRANGGAGEASDIAIGALEELGQEHRESEHAYAVQLAETLLLWRSLQRMRTHEAHLAALALVGIDDGAWLAEARNWLRREGRAVTAAVILARSHDDRFVRQWGRWGMDHLGAGDPGRSVQELEDEQLADVLRAYATIRMQSAMRVIVSYVGSERRGVRRAARWAMEQYGGNGIWILRTAYRNETGEHPPRAWGWRRLTEELHARTDARRFAPVQRALDEGVAARDRGDFAVMAARFDDVLARAPELADPAPVAAGYAAAAEASEDADASLRGYRRALRLAPEHPDADRWRAAVVFLEAEQARAAGVLDEDAFATALRLDPGHEGAAAVLAGIAPARTTVGSAMTPRQTPAAVAAIVLLGLLGLGLLWRGSSERPEPLEDFAHDSTLDARTLDEADATLADATLPG